MSYLKFVKTKLHNKILSNPTISKSIVATTAGIATANANLAMMRCEGLEGASDARDSIIDTIIGVYRTWWWLPFLIALITWLALKEDDKNKPVAKKWWMGLMIAFVGTYAWDLIMATVNKIASVFG